LLLIAVSLTYGLWYIRNEIIVARAENPGLRNMSLIFSHVYTETGASAAAEIGARLARSAEFYGPALLSLITHPFDAAWTYSVTDSTDGMLASVQAILGAARWPLALVSGIPVALGAARIVRRGVFGPFLAALLPAYGAIIVLYPVSDVRFIFPLLLLLLWCAAEGIVLPLERLKGGGRRAGIAAVSALVCLMALPNMAWVRNVVCTNAAFRKDPGEFVASHARSDPYPNELMLIPRRAAAWIAANSPPETVVGSKIKSAAVWLDGRPLVVLNPLLPVEEFDNRIRDYGIRYLVCELQAHQIPDFSLQMALSTRHTFQGEFAFGDIRVYHVREKADPREPSVVPPPEGFGAAEALYLQGVSALAYGDQKRAAATFEALERVPGVETTALFYAAVAHEFTMNLDTAEALFARFRTIPQSAVYLRQAQVHEFIIALLRSASQDPPGEEKASKYQEAAMSYWMLGFRVQAVRMLREALRLEPGYFAGNVFGALFSLSGGDTSGARKGVALAERAKPADPLTRSLKLILACIDSLPRAADRGKLEVAIGREYAAMGLYEMGIDQAMKALREGEDPDALRLLADLYIKKERHGPALSALLRLQKLSPGDPAAAAEIRQLAALLE
ncbi:MAG TPA: hypothetical protein VK569_01625, partial [Bacteroidota bacterium]|nr:hypothetical protein [Bacteroidota bacterium]